MQITYDFAQRLKKTEKGFSRFYFKALYLRNKNYSDLQTIILIKVLKVHISVCVKKIMVKIGQMLSTSLCIC